MSDSDYLPPEMWINVLKRLPVKALLRFRSVCKEWYSLIANPNFISQHLHTSLATPHTLVRYCTQNPNDNPYSFSERYSVRFDNKDAFDEYAEPDFPFKSSKFHLRVVGSCNGLLCLYEFGLESNIPLDNLLLWNPLVGKSVVVPRPRNLCYPPWSHTFGFGFDELRNDYKVVAIMAREYSEYQPRVEVYSLNSGVWQEIRPKGLRYYTLGYGATHAYLNGVAHWVATDFRTSQINAKFSYILTFCIKDEVFGEMMLPKARTKLGKVMVTVVHNSLAFINTDKYFEDVDIPRFWVWMMKKYGDEESWTLLFRVDTSSVLGWPVGFRVNGELVMETKAVSLVSYDPESKQVKDLEIHGWKLQKELFGYPFYLGKYVESLVLLDRGASALVHMGTTDGSLLI